MYSSNVSKLGERPSDTKPIRDNCSSSFQPWPRVRPTDCASNCHPIHIQRQGEPNRRSWRRGIASIHTKSESIVWFEHNFGSRSDLLCTQHGLVMVNSSGVRSYGYFDCARKDASKGAGDIDVVHGSNSIFCNSRMTSTPSSLYSSKAIFIDVSPLALWNWRYHIRLVEHKVEKGEWREVNSTVNDLSYQQRKIQKRGK